ncbi:PhnD/SsuA/transferrin family substrate-binding protein [Roseovarius sp. SCSIO 43702]|uniref:phosphate/phosphite/phosphonate ABC transporter substrate-binding protein n=1 Tax=Roseovarius sp. SCSIO 43702 TaxID=2823043 RepID=UPI001C73009E|nr:PhnD/SsuA/transferrin family substrate-binding protein [Roseovarius sp. SCSIO 43702]QYX55862.1 PhnD/SsuA/transferrin family substrate-binding protein [Roseovarius sp. SCSIO 43702]
MIASLPMYDRPETAAANDRLWSEIAARLEEAPEALTRGGDPWEHWLSPDLVFSQTCGFPYRARLHDKVTLIGTPDYDLPHCPPGHYNSVLVIRADDPRETLAEFSDAPFAYNDAMSQSGWAAPVTHAANEGVTLSPALETGGHAASAAAVAEGRADLAAIDALSWHYMLAYGDFTGKLRELARTEPTPALPYIAAKGADRDALFAAVSDAIAALPPDLQQTLHLTRLVEIAPDDYLAVPTPDAPPDRRG